MDLIAAMRAHYGRSKLLLYTLALPIAVAIYAAAVIAALPVPNWLAGARGRHAGGPNRDLRAAGRRPGLHRPGREHPPDGHATGRPGRRAVAAATGQVEGADAGRERGRGAAAGTLLRLQRAGRQPPPARHHRRVRLLHPLPRPADVEDLRRRRRRRVPDPGADDHGGAAGRRPSRCWRWQARRSSPAWRSGPSATSH